MSNKKPSVSIVVPIYNVEKYLRVCVDSLLAQTLKNIEIILVDDGSPDGCGKIIDEYAAKDKRIVVKHQTNAGYSAAVNAGIKMAHAEYIGIVEPDDFVDTKMYEKLVAEVSKYTLDVAKAMFYKYDSTKTGAKRAVPFCNPGGVDLKKAPKAPFRPGDWPAIMAFHASIWSAIYKAQLIKEIPLSETKGASYQDLPFMVSVMAKAERVGVVKEPLYYWRNEPGQNHSTSATSKKALLMADNTLLSLEILEESGKFEELKEGFFAQAYYANIAFFAKIKRQYKQAYFLKMKEIFAVAEDHDIKYCYLRSEDIWAISKLQTAKSWRALKAAYTLGRLKRLVKKFRFW